MKAFLAWLRLWCWKYIGTLVMEPKAGGLMAMSLGRVAFVAILVQFFVIWHRAVIDGAAVELPPGLLDVFYAVTGYTLGSKVLGAFKRPPDAPPGDAEGEAP